MRVFSDKTMSRLTPRLFFFFQGVMTECDPCPPLLYRSRIRKARYFQSTRQTVLIQLHDHVKQTVQKNTVCRQSIP